MSNHEVWAGVIVMMTLFVCLTVAHVADHPMTLRVKIETDNNTVELAHTAERINNQSTQKVQLHKGNYTIYQYKTTGETK
jgi:hypothetical protein